MKKYFILLSFLLFACSDDIKHDGTIMITASDNCEFRIFDEADNFVSFGVWELQRQPTVIYLKKTGLYYIRAETYNGVKTVCRSFNFVGGIFEYYIEF
jgi:hypothetical protein